MPESRTHPYFPDHVWPYAILAMATLITLGLLAELQARTYHESQNKPIYVIREILESLPEASARDYHRT